MLFRSWVTEHLGARAIVYPGLGLRDHARAAMQVLSGVASLGQAEMLGGVAWWAHIGGFVAGLLSVGVLAPRRLTQVA